MKIRYAALAALLALANLAGNALAIHAAPVDRLVLLVNPGGMNAPAVTKWVLILFSGAALIFTAGYLAMCLIRHRRGQASSKPTLEARSMWTASVAVALMGWILILAVL